MRRKFHNYPMGHIDLAEVWTNEGKLYLFVAIDRVSQFAFAALRARATPRIAADFLRRLIERVPYTIHFVLTDNGFQFTPPHGGWTVAEIQQKQAADQPFRAHAFDFACAHCGSSIASRNSKVRGPWASRTNEPHHQGRTIRRFYYDTHESLRAHLDTFLDALPSA